MRPEVLQERPEADGIESVLLAAIEEAAVAESNGAEVADAAAGRVVEHHGVFDLGRYPHATARSILLEMHFVRGPEVHRGIATHLLEFFGCTFWRSGSAGAIRGRGLRNRNLRICHEINRTS